MRILAIAIFALLALGANAQAAPPVTDPVAAQVIANLKARYPATQIGDLRSTPVPGLYEMTLGPNIAYVNASGRYFFFGHVYDMEKQVDLTDARQSALDGTPPAASAQGTPPPTPISAQTRAQLLSELRLEDAIRTGGGKRVLYVFADPNCGFCKALESTIALLQDATVYTFLYPILGLDSQTKAEAIWCNKDRAKAYSNWMRSGTPIPPASGCSTPTARILDLGHRLGVNATPTLFTPDGRTLAGARPLEELSLFLDPPKPLAKAQ